MKANRKFLKNDDEAVSPVIAVILMVAITVVLAATVYVWVSGFGSQSGSPAKSLSLTSNGAYDSTGFVKEYVVASATQGMKYSDMSFTIDGAPFTLAVAAGDNVWYIERGGTALTPLATAQSAAVTAGDVIVIDDDADMSGKQLRILDAQANSIILTLTIT